LGLLALAHSGESIKCYERKRHGARPFMKDCPSSTTCVYMAAGNPDAGGWNEMGCGDSSEQTVDECKDLPDGVKRCTCTTNNCNTASLLDNEPQPEREPCKAVAAVLNGKRKSVIKVAFTTKNAYEDWKMQIVFDAWFDDGKGNLMGSHLKGLGGIPDLGINCKRYSRGSKCPPGVGPCTVCVFKGYDLQSKGWPYWSWKAGESVDFQLNLYYKERHEYPQIYTIKILHDRNKWDNVDYCKAN